MFTAVMTGSLLLGLLARPPVGSESVWLTYVFYATVIATPLTVLIALPLSLALEKRGLPYAVQLLLFALAGASLGLPAAILGLIIEGNALWWLLGTLPGLWCALVGGIVLPVYRRFPRAAVIVVSISVLVVVAGGFRTFGGF